MTRQAYLMLPTKCIVPHRFTRPHHPHQLALAEAGRVASALASAQLFQEFEGIVSSAGDGRSDSESGVVLPKPKLIWLISCAAQPGCHDLHARKHPGLAIRTMALPRLRDLTVHRPLPETT